MFQSSLFFVQENSSDIITDAKEIVFVCGEIDCREGIPGEEKIAGQQECSCVPL